MSTIRPSAWAPCVSGPVVKQCIKLLGNNRWSEGTHTTGPVPEFVGSTSLGRGEERGWGVRGYQVGITWDWRSNQLIHQSQSTGHRSQLNVMGGPRKWNPSNWHWYSISPPSGNGSKNQSTSVDTNGPMATRLVRLVQLEQRVDRSCGRIRTRFPQVTTITSIHIKWYQWDQEKEEEEEERKKCVSSWCIFVVWCRPLCFFHFLVLLVLLWNAASMLFLFFSISFHFFSFFLYVYIMRVLLYYFFECV